MEQYIIPNLSKACRLLCFLSEHPEGVSMVEIEKELTLPKTTAFRILKTFCASEMACKEKSLYFPGTALFRIGLQSLHGTKLREKGIPILRMLTDSARQTSHIAIPSGSYSLILEVCDSPNPVRVASRPGSLVDLHCSSTGKIFLAFLFMDRLDEIFKRNSLHRRTPHTITDKRRMRAHLETISREGYAVDDEEYHTGVRCIASPVRDMQSHVVAAIGITGPSIEITSDRIPDLANRVMQAADQLSRSLGYSKKEARSIP